MAPSLSLSLSLAILFGVHLHYLTIIISTDWARLRYAMLHCICSRKSLACVLSTYCATPARHEHQGLLPTDEHGLRCKRNTVEGLNLSLSGMLGESHRLCLWCIRGSLRALDILSLCTVYMCTYCTKCFMYVH